MDVLRIVQNWFVCVIFFIRLWYKTTYTVHFNWFPQCTPWKINMVHLHINHLERKMIWTKPPWLCSMLIFRGVSYIHRMEELEAATEYSVHQPRIRWHCLKQLARLKATWRRITHDQVIPLTHVGSMSHPWRLTWNILPWRFGSDHLPFQMVDV